MLSLPPSSSRHRSKTDLTPALNPPPQSRPPTAQAELPQSSSSSPAKLFQFAACPPAVKPDVTPSSTPEPQTRPETRSPLSLPLLSSPSGARTGPVKTGRRVFVLDHKRWPTPMKKAIDDLLNKHRGQKDVLKLVDQDYAGLVHNSCKDPNSMLHPTAKLHIAQYLKHLSKLLNTSSSLNTSPEKLQERQELLHSLTKGSTTTSVY
ncbi:uncharacterized protein LOC120560453 [Perca fluviatilis]|uniref:uncharacterized protein LOC120560453 n=1 Tax=Perca fluviatilis TaxID=8168 RepID=UPI001962B87C|nr:uncharacterized protein LOC120560453 [Perca fluviatilis]